MLHKALIKRLFTRIGMLDYALIGRDYVRAIKFLKQNIGYASQTAVDGLPIPPLHLISLVTGKPDRVLFFETGHASAKDITAVLIKNNLTIENFRKILDFGCGSGRVLRHWRHLQGTEVYGTDYNARLIKWCKSNLTFAHFQINSLHPPLNYPDGEFDFVYCLSVFTHLTEELQDEWFEEIYRLLAEKGYLLFTTHGEYFLSQLNQRDQQQFHQGQLVVQNGGPVGSNLLGTYHPPKYVLEKLSPKFELIDFIPQGATGNPCQDLYLLRK